MGLEQKIEALLFWKGEPVRLKKLAELLTVSEEEIKTGILALKEKLQGRGVSLIEKEDEVMLVTTGECSELIEKLTKEELSKDLGKASLETLSIVLYQGPIKRSEIDYIRGVNSQFILRNLLVRGLIEKITDPKDARTFVYKPSFELLAHLNVKNIEELPDYEAVRKDIESFKTAGMEPEKSQEVENDENLDSRIREDDTGENSGQNDETEIATDESQTESEPEPELPENNNSSI